MEGICTVSGQTFELDELDRQYYLQLGIPIPKLCPRERQRRRLSFRNDRYLYRRTCDATGAAIFSVYSKDKPFPVYENDYWWSDSWDPLAYGVEFDFSRPFFEQFYEQQCRVPHRALNVTKPTIENSEYCNQIGYAKNCYLIFDSRHAENCMYSKTCLRSFDCVDCYKVYDCEACYQLLHCWNCSFSTYLFDCQNSSDCHFSSDLIGCNYCFGCTDLRNKRYYLFNKKQSKEEWRRKVDELLSQHSGEALLQQHLKFRQTQSVKRMQVRNCEDCTGDHLVNCKNSRDCFDSENLENCRYCCDIAKDNTVNFNNYDISYFGGSLESCCECLSVGYTGFQLMFCENVWNSSDVLYSRMCNATKNLFGCISVMSAENCILNKQYSEKDYHRLRARIIEHMKETGEWGEFFPIECSPHAYNETLAQEYFPLEAEEVRARGWSWKERELTMTPSGQPYVVPSSIAGVDDDVLKHVLICEETGQPYRIVAPELAFYRKMKLPLPRSCFEARHLKRLALSKKGSVSFY